MFSKGISASLLEATKKVMKDEESGLRMAAHAAHRQGKKMFHFQGKTYPITVKEDNVEIGEPLEEAESPYKEKTPTGMRVYGSSYGNSAKAKRDQSRHAVDDVSGPSKKDMEKAHTEKNPEHYKDKDKDHAAKQYKRDSVQKYFSKVGEEVEYDGEQLDELSKDSLNAYLHKGVSKLKQNAHKMSQSEKQKKAAHLQKAHSKLKAKGGKFEEYELDEAGDCVTPPQAKDIAKKEVGKHEKGMHKKGFKDKLIEREMTAAQSKKKEKIVMSMKDKTEYFKKKYGKNWKSVMYATATKNAMKEEVELDEAEMTTDMLRGRVEGGKDTHGMTGDFKSFKVKLKGELEKRPDESDVTKPNTDNQGETAERQKITTNPGPVEIKMDDKYGHPNNHDHGQYYDPQRHSKYDMTNTNLKNEEVELAEKNDSHTHAAHYENEKGEWTGMNLFTAKDDDDAIKQAQSKCKEGCRLSKVERHTTVKEEFAELDELSLQTMKSAREKLKSKAFDAHYDDNKYAAQHYAARAVQMGTKIKRKERSALPPVKEEFAEYTTEEIQEYLQSKDFEQLDEIDRNALYHKLQAHIANKNKAYSADKAREFSGGKLRDAGEKKASLDKHVAGIKKAQRTLGKVTAKPHNIKSEEFTEAKDPHIDAGVGAQPNEAMGHTPLTRAKEMARNAMNRVKTEMLGKAPGNN